MWIYNMIPTVNSNKIQSFPNSALPKMQVENNGNIINKRKRIDATQELGERILKKIKIAPPSFRQKNNADHHRGRSFQLFQSRRERAGSDEREMPACHLAESRARKVLGFW